MAEKTTFRGIARDVNWRRRGENWDILTFRIERIDNEGNVIDYVPVTMEGYIKGNVVDGDEVEVVGKMGNDGLLNAEIIRNISTKAYIRVQKSSLIFIPFIFVCLFILFGTLAMLGQEGPGGLFTGFAMLSFIGGIISFIIILIISALKNR